jgi:REP element-mobilizing transposase RayT
MSQSLSSLLVHLIFSTKDRCPFLGKSDLLQPTHAYLGGILRRVQCPAITIGGTADHVHAFFQLARTQNVAKVVEVLKSGSSQWLKSQGMPAFAWQRGYGCFSIGKSQTETLAHYIASQAEHHQKISFQEELREILRKYGVAFDERYLWD